MRALTAILFWLAAALQPSSASAQRAVWVVTEPVLEGFALADASGLARVVTSTKDHEVVTIAAADLREDLQRVSGREPRRNGAEVWAGTIGRSPAIDRLIAEGKLDAKQLRGALESFIIASVERPAPGVPKALVIAGSDRRGTAFGIYELSRAVGVSPWHWWADVTPQRQPHLYVRAGTHRFGPPSVKYRGIFINDEDWGLAPWAATNFEPERRGIGPKTYARVFELLLRLKANSLWPAMHKVTPAFSADPANARLAHRYAIVMGSSHAEPMLRNNVGEWTGPEADYNYQTNAPAVRRYWEERLRTNGRFENVYTLGMRGIHDSGIAGASSMEDRRALLEGIIKDQRDLLRKHVSPQVERLPQVFTPYKEVLDIYRAGLGIPDDVTLMWPDDNFGYIRRFPTAAERRRPGGSGIYYHLSYLGAPLAYLWLSTTPPALIAEEMGRAFDLGANRIWIANVGDIKPAELGTDYFLSLAWDVPATRAIGVDGFVRRWAKENIDSRQSAEIARVFAEHHRLNFERRPEHLQWWLPGEKPRMSPYSPADAHRRIAAFDRNVALVRRIMAQVTPARRDAAFQLLQYPVEAAAAANRRFFAAEAHDRLRESDFNAALVHAASAHSADARIRALTEAYGSSRGGKWRGLMAVEPADGMWKSYRALPPVLPALPASIVAKASPPPANADHAEFHLNPTDFKGNWRLVPGLGRGGSSLASHTSGAVQGSAQMNLPEGRWALLIDLVPTYPDVDGKPLLFNVSVDGRPIELAVVRETGDAAWKQAVLDNRITVPAGDPLAGGAHSIELRAASGGVIVERLRFVRANAP